MKKILFIILLTLSSVIMAESSPKKKIGAVASTSIMLLIIPLHIAMPLTAIMTPYMAVFFKDESNTFKYKHKKRL